MARRIRGEFKCDINLQDKRDVSFEPGAKNKRHEQTSIKKLSRLIGDGQHSRLREIHTGLRGSTVRLAGMITEVLTTSDNPTVWRSLSVLRIHDAWNNT